MNRTFIGLLIIVCFLHVEQTFSQGVLEKFKSRQQRVREDTSISHKDDTTTYSVVENMPYFSGGRRQLKKYLSQANFSQAIIDKSNEQGKNYIRFVVDKHGNLINISLAKPDALSLDSTTLAYIRNMPKWEPGKRRKGDLVRVQQVIPVRVK